MPSDSGLTLKKPIAVWNKPLKANFKDLFKALGKAGINAATGQWVGLGKDAVDALSAVGLDGGSPAELSWALIYNSLSSAVCSLVADSQFLIKEVVVNPDVLCDALDFSLENEEFELSEDFFVYPDQSKLLTAVQKPLRQWLVSVGVSDFDAGIVSNRLPTYFVLALNHEWRSRSEYGAIITYINTPFAEANERLRGWQLYKAWLQKQTQEPMMFEVFGLEDVYIPLRAYFRRSQSDNLESASCSSNSQERLSNTEKVVVDLASSLTTWIHTADKNDAIRVISGGPGAGKSSFAKIFAAQHARRESFPVLLIPLHLLNHKGDLVDEVGNFIRFDHCLKQNPLRPDDESLRLLLILDGLDELMMQGKLLKESVLEFVRNVKSTVKLFNHRHTRLQVIVTGREITMQSVFQNPAQVLHVLPYCILQPRADQDIGEPLVDPDKLLGDQRHEWWRKYGMVTQQAFKALPTELSGDELTEIMAQPLLNYLVALSYTQDKLTTSKAVNLNTLYADLLDAVYERGYDEHRRHASVGDLSKSDFLRVLEEIAMSVWHGKGRTTTVKEIEERCNNNGLKKKLEIFQEGAIAGVTRLLAAFYFRQNGVRSDEQTFEFTHKSFGEYLVARRIVAALHKIQKQIDRRQEDLEDGWDSRDALLYWLKTCGPTRMDSYLLVFLRAEVALRTPEEVAKWQATLSELIGIVMYKSLPVESIEPSLKFHVANSWAINGEESLLVALNACAQVTKSVSVIKWPTPEAFGAWISRLQGQKSSDSDNIVTLLSLSYLDLSHTMLDFRDLRCANFEGTNLSGASLIRASLDGANLRGVNLDDATLDESILTKANLSGASLIGASLEGANLNSSSLVGASLNYVNLDGASLVQARLLEAILNDASLREANLDSANLARAVLIRADLDGATLNAARFTDSRLDNACLDGTSCEGISLMGATLSGASLAGASLNHASLYGASFDGADLDGASLDCARLLGASLLGASLEGTNLEQASCDGANLLKATLARTNFRRANLSNIIWDEGTAWIDVQGLHEATNVPELLRQQLNL